MKRLSFIFITIALASCLGPKQTAQEPVMEVELPEIEVVGEDRPYRASNPRTTDIIHTRLDLSFDWKKSHVLGEATITAKPYFYSLDTIWLDAKGMDIHSVELETAGLRKPLTYDYDGMRLGIAADRIYTRKDQFTLRIKYTGKPNELPMGGSAAIAGNKGLYFINPDSTDVRKPSQIWTQGETEHNSVWFPTVDSPNERMTHEIHVTYPGKMVSLSNGDLIFTKHNPDGTKTDYWSMNQPHTPYLVMLAIGDFRVFKDSYTKKSGEKIEVNYYVEPEYEAHAKAIFGATPEMLKVFSDRLGVEYPWSKYSQIVVRDYVSGAMENTGAVIHGDFLHQTTRELVDGNNEAIIAHELFHHWFGDLVTCESWSNLPLNESFATYGEYLWNETKHGRDEADYNFHSTLKGYLSEARFKKEYLIRFHYDDHEDMFDSHSYAKGGRVLHMLRFHMGDEAFFEGLKKYLNDNAFKTVEIHQLRLAFEEVTGLDWNWFFNQWFLGKGHPELTIDHEYIAAEYRYKLTVTQTQDLSESGLFRLPLRVSVWESRGMKLHDVVVDKKENVFYFPVSEEPVLVNFDADKILLGTKKDKMPATMRKQQFYKATNYLDRLEAMEYAKKFGDSSFDSMIQAALSDPHKHIRGLAVDMMPAVMDRNPTAEMVVSMMIGTDPSPSVRAKAIRMLAEKFPDGKYEKKYFAALDDESYNVIGAALNALMPIQPKETLKRIKSLENEPSKTLKLIIADIYATHGTDAESEFFVKAIPTITGFEKLSIMQTYARYLKGKQPATIRAALPAYEDMARNSGIYWMKMIGYNSLSNLKTECETRAAEGDPKADELKALGKDIADLIAAIKKDETDPRLKMLGGAGGFEIRFERE
jgi:aminopeptidase N